MSNDEGMIKSDDENRPSKRGSSFVHSGFVRHSSLVFRHFLPVTQK